MIDVLHQSLAELPTAAPAACASEWTKVREAAVKNDPILLIVPTFIPSIELLRDLRTYTKGAIDVTSDAVLADKVKRVNRGVVARRVGGTFVPVPLLCIVPAGGPPGQVLDEAQPTVQQRIKQVANAVADRCKALAVCP